MSSLNPDGPEFYSEAQKLYLRGVAFREAISLGVDERQLSFISGVSVQLVREAMSVSAMFATQEEFTSAYNSHPIPPGANGRTWSTFLTHLGINVLTPKQVEASIASVKETLLRVVLAASSSANPELAQEALGTLRSWIESRCPTTVWSTIDENFFRHAPCSYCGDEGAVDQEVVPVAGMLSAMCMDCRSSGAQPGSVNWEILARTYAAYARECNSAAELHRTY